MINKERHRYGVNVLGVCKKVEMSPQNYYARRKERQRRDVQEELVVEFVKEERWEQPRMGTQKLQVRLAEKLEIAGIQIGRDRMYEVLRDRDMLVKPLRRRCPKTTDSRHYLRKYDNEIKDLKVEYPNQVWVSDLTYLRTQEGFLYLSLITDKYSRKIVGYHCGDTLETEGCLKALGMAIKQKPRNATPIHHSDRGSQYCSHVYVKMLNENKMGISMTEQDHCAENAMAERMNGILKQEYGLGLDFNEKEDCRRAVDQAVEIYNTKRPHRSIGMKYPEEVYSLAA